MDIWHKLGRIFRISNLGTMIFFLLNICFIYSFMGRTTQTGYLIIFYIVTVAISLSPIGEWFLCVIIRAENIKRTDVKIHVIPLVEIVLDSAKKNSTYNLDKVNVKLIHNDSPNAFAIGKYTIAITSGLLKLPDEYVMAVIAHEIGHLEYGHTVIQLLIGGGNIFITGCILIIKISCWIISAIMGMFSLAAKNGIIGVITVIFAGVSYGMTWLWVKFCKLFLMWSMRQNEFVADEYAAKIGFGYELAYALDHQLCDIPHDGFLNALYNTHPSNNDRIVALQNLGVNYSRD